MYVMAKVQTSADMTKERRKKKNQINLSVESVGGLQWSGHGTQIHWSHQMMCLGFDEREDATRTSVAQTRKNDNRHNGTINNTKGSSRTCRGLRLKKQTSDRPVLPQRGLLGSVVSNRRHSLRFFRAPSVRSLQRRPPPSFITTGVHLSTVLPFLPFLPLFRSLPLYSSPPCVVVRGGGGGSHFPSNIKPPPYRQARGPPSRGAAWTCCIGCCPSPSRRWTDHIYFFFSNRYRHPAQEGRNFCEKKKPAGLRPLISTCLACKFLHDGPKTFSSPTCPDEIWMFLW